MDVEYEKLDPDKLKAREDAIRQLLTICAEKEIDVPEDVRLAILGEDIVRAREEEEPETVVDSLKQHRAEILAEMENDELLKHIYDTWTGFKAELPAFECRILDGSYSVTNRFETEQVPSFSDYAKGKSTKKAGDGEDVEEEDVEKGPVRAKQKIPTVASASPVGMLFRRMYKSIYTKGHAMEEETKAIMEGVNLRFESGKMYLVLGAPGCGKSTLLKMIANTLTQDKDHVVGGDVTINGISQNEKGVYWPNLSLHIDQIDRLHPYLTVQETLKFAWECRNAGTHLKPSIMPADDPEVVKLIEKLDEESWRVKVTMEGFGLARVKDTFVGDNTSVRGVSGGEKKRVTVAEMACVGVPVMCCDEISTGLDAATTYDITKLLRFASQMVGGIKIVSLLQPPPETVALFDELILLDSGRVIYAGPVDDVVDYFQDLGYELPERMDVADWLQQVPSKDGAKLRKKDAEGGHLTTTQFKEKFDNSQRGMEMKEACEAPYGKEHEGVDMKGVKTKFRNPWFRSLRLLVSREMLLWWRDKYQIKARVAQDLIMGVVAGTVFWQQNDDPQSVMGILFQSMFFVCVGAMLKVPGQFEPRGIFYKQQDANFFPTWTFVAGRSLAAIPTSVIDGVLYGSLVYWFVGLAHDQGASIANFFIFMLLILTASLTAGLMFSVFSATVKDKSTGQACMAVAIVVLVLFSGFTVQPDVIPNYWIWVYWLNMFGWILRSLVLNEFQSGKYDTPTGTGSTVGEEILRLYGFVRDGEVYTFEWVWWGLLFTIGCAALSIVASTCFLSAWRFETGKGLGTDIPDDPDEDYVVEEVSIPFQKVNLTFKDIHYTVTASTSDEKLELLRGIDGYIEAGKMTALMGSSGAGKTTLMDVLSLRKSSGEITGEVMLNGHLQESKSFRRCTGYVEQFDVQSPSQTIRETVEFSAKLRLDESDPMVTDENVKLFVDQTLEMLELTIIQDLQVGSDLTGGLSFEQRKRLSIAVEIVSNPSILFLDEPTSGLDARAASIVMRGLKRIAQTGRAVCATIHQPSIAIFNDFDSLLLLKRGGEVVFFGELGEGSKNLIEYFERYTATPKIQPGENPATWMLTTIGAGSAKATGKPFNYADSYADSKLRQQCLAQIEQFEANPTEENKVLFPTKYATKDSTQRSMVLRRIIQVYWRSPSYNAVRLIVSLVVALLFGSVYASQRVPQNEGDMNSRVTSIFITFIFLSVNAMNTVLHVFEVERNMFYRHKAALMYTERALLLGFTVAEIPFIMLASLVFCVGFYFLVGFSTLFYKMALYLLFFTLNLGCWTFLGQMLMSLFRDSVTAQGFGGLLVSFTSLFSGLLIRPNNLMGTFWVFMYWLMPGHYVLEGLVASQFHNDRTVIEANPGSPFFLFNNCTVGQPTACEGYAEDWIYVSFGGEFKYENIPWNILYLVALLIGARLITWFGLTKLNYLAK